MSDRRGMSPAGSYSSLTGSFTPRSNSPTAMSPRGQSPAPGRLGSSLPIDPRAGAGIQMAIQNLQHEQERVQKKTFTNWMNTYLKQRSDAPRKVEELFSEIKDGVVLLSLLEILSGEKLPMEKGPRLKRPHHLSNISTALQFLDKKKIKMVNINSTDIADGKPSIVLGLIWTIILYFQIEETISNVPNVGDMDGDGPSKKKKPAMPKQSLLAWADSVLAKKYGLTVKDFGKSWRDGVAFNAMIHNIRPDLVDMDQVRRQNARVNLEHAFSTAEDELGIPRLLDPEDIDVDKPDEKSVMTYVATILKAYPDPGDPNYQGVPNLKMETGDQEQQAYTAIMNWLNQEARDTLDEAQNPVTDRAAELKEYMTFKAELDKREPVYRKIGEKVTSGTAIKLTPQDWQKLDSKWLETEDQTQKWLLKLDLSLPGKLGQFGQWLYNAERLLEKREQNLDNLEEMAVQMGTLLSEHKTFFKDLEAQKQFFLSVKRSGRYEGEFLDKTHLDLLSKRTERVGKMAPRRQRRLEYLEARYTLQAQLEAAEQRAAYWNVKYGRQEDVEAMLADYRKFVEKDKLFDNYKKASTDTKKKAEMYKNNGGDPIDMNEMSIVLGDIDSRWQRTSGEIQTAGHNLAEVDKAWRVFSPSVEALTVWLTEGENVMQRSMEEKQAFFESLKDFEGHHQALNESGNSLVTVSDPTVAAEIQNTLDMLNRRYTELTDAYTNFQRVEVIGRARDEYAEGTQQIEVWLQRADEIVGPQIPCLHAELKEHLQQLDTLGSQVPEIESVFKMTTKTAQSLVKDSSSDVVNDMLATLNVQKEVILKLRKEIPDRSKVLKACLPNVESLETGIADLNRWLDQGEQLLQTHRLDGSGEATEARLERHKAYFSEITYQKSILESKNKVFQKVIGVKGKLKSVDFTPAEESMAQVNQRFQDCVKSAKDWEKRLENLARLWRSLQQKQNVLVEWMDNAETVLEDKEDDPETLIRKHKLFFERSNQRVLQEYLGVGEEILNQLEGTDRAALEKEMKNNQDRWNNIHYHAPIKLLKLEFAVPEDKFIQKVTVAETAIKQHQEQLTRNANVKEALLKHRQLFHESDLVPTCEKCLGSMETLSSKLLGISQEERSLRNRYEDHLQRWKRLHSVSDNTHEQLKQLPQRWKDYNTKLGEVSRWIMDVEGLMAEMQKEDLTSDEYKEMLARFQQAMRNKSKYMDDAKTLNENLQELLKDEPNADAAKEKAKLKEIMDKFGKLDSGMKTTSDKSSVFSKSFDYRDNLERRANWLDETQRQVMEHPPIDSLDDARAYLQEHESIMSRLEAEAPNIQADIEAGKRLQRERNAPLFVGKTVDDLSRKWKDTNELARAKLAKLRGTVQDWEKYEGEKTQLVQYLKKAEAELDKPSIINGQDMAQKDLQTKKELHNTLNKLKGSISEMQKLNEALAEGASRERRTPLKSEMTDIDKRLENVSVRLNAKLSDLEATIAKWSEYYNRLNNFCDWLNEKETKLNDVYENKRDMPDQQLTKAEAIASEVYENHITLETLEKDARGLSNNFRSRETAALKSKLTTLRRQWESLCARAKDRSTTLSGNVVHWQEYQRLQEQLMPFILKAEKYCTTEPPKCGSLDEARELYDVHQAFLQECEEHLPLFEKMSTEAGYLMEQPDMPRELEIIQGRWGHILNASEERTHRMDKMFGAWTAFDEEQDNFVETLEKFKNRLGQEPNTSSTDIQVLEHELALAKALQDEIRSQQPQMNALQRRHEQVQPYATPAGLEKLREKQEEVKDTWNTVNSGVLDRQKVLNTALQHRRDFYGRMQDFEKWLKKAQRKLDTGSEIYSDEVADEMEKLKALRGECSHHDPVFQALQQEFKEMMQNCSPEEAAVLSDRFDKIMDNYTKVEDLINNRENLCDNWTRYNEDHKDSQAKLKALQARLQSPDLTEQEVADIKREIAAVKAGMAKWNKEADNLDDLMGTAQMVIKDRATQRTLHFNSELQNLDNMCDSVADVAQQKEEHLGELSQLGDDFLAKKDDLVIKLQKIQDKIANAAVDKSNLQGLKELIREVEDIRDDMYTYNPEYEQLRELGRQIMQSDPSKAQDLQRQLSEVNQVWEGVQATIADKHQYLNSVGNLWQQYNEAKTGVVRVLDDVDPLVKQEIAFATHADVKKSLDKHKNAEFELHANQTQLDHMNTKGLQLLEELAKVPGFDLKAVEGDLDEVNHNWETANKTIIDDHRENLEAQLVCWDQLQSGKDEVAAWVNSMVSKLDDSLKNFDDAVSVEARLLKFKEEAPYFEEVLKEVNQKMNDLKELNGGRDLPGLTQETQDIMAKFEKASTMARELQDVVETYSDEQKQLQDAIDAETEWMNKMKDKLAKCDDITGSDDDLIARLMASKEFQEEFAEHKKRMADIQAKTRALQAKYPSAEMNNLAKDANVMTKKFEALEGRADRISDSLTTTLEQHCQEAQQQQARWLNQAKEKVAWCDDLAGDRYSVEAKLSTIKDLKSGLEDGEQKRAAAAAQLEKIKAVLPKSKQAELEAQKKAMDRDWDSLVGQMEQTQDKLESSIDQFTDYDGQYDELSRWLKDTEAKMRNLSALKPDLEGKQEQQKMLQELEAEVAERKREFEELRDNANQISRTTGDNRTASYAGQLLNRFQALNESVKDQNEKCDSNIAAHEEFEDTYGDAMEWLENAKRELEECQAAGGDEEELRAKLAKIQDLLGNKEEGLARFNAALEHGEKLYPNTSNQGRENIRRELRGLRDTWENFQDKLNETQRQLESSKMQWSSFDENFDQLAKWIDDTEKHVTGEPELRNTLQEKKAQLQQYKTRYQDIMSHQTMVDSLSDKGAALASGQVQNKLKQLNQRYKQLCSQAQDQVKKAEEHVDQHQLYQDNNQHCRDWINATRDKLAVCSEVSGDRQALQNRLDRVKGLQAGLGEGEAKLQTAKQHLEKTLRQTAPQGQRNIQQEMEGLDQEWVGLEHKMEDMEHGLEQALEALESYDGSCDTLGRWLRDVESRIKDADPKSSLEDKQRHVEELKALQREIEAKQEEFGDLQTMASQVQGADARQIGHSTQLATKYEGLKASIKDAIRKTQDNADEHQTYENNLSQSNDWINTLRKRLEVCGDLAGDKQDVDNRLAMLHQLAAEKDSGRLNVMQAIDAGEKLYPNTSSDGREVIRQDIRNLRENWEQLCDEVTATQRKLECSMLEWSAYDDSFEQFQKWLLDAEVKLREDGEMKATLPDKRAQLQNHKVLHQDILSRQHIMNNLMDKAHNLTQSSPSAKVNKFVAELQAKYQALCETSKDVLGKLETSVKDHQQYQDAYHDLQDWLNLSREKLDSCADRSGDRLSLQGKQERLKEFAGSLPSGEKKLQKTSELCERTAQNTSAQGCEVLKREVEHIQREWDDYVNLMQQVDTSLDQAMVQWGDFESKFEKCAEWLKQMEQAVKNHELKSTLKEKHVQVDRFKKQREEILSHQPEIDRFMDEAQNLMHTSSDVRLSTQVSQLTNRYQGLLSLVKDLINKWEKYVNEHQTYDSRLAEFTQWLAMSNQRLSGCQQPVGDQETMEEKRAVIQILFSEKEHGLQKLNLAIEAGEKLFPDTASQGRDKVRSDLRTAKEDWEKLFNGLNDAQRKVDAFLMQWSSYADGQEQLMRWLTETEGALRADMDVKNTLQEKRMQLQNHRSLLQDITSHQRLVDSVVEKAQGVLHSTPNSDVASFITSINSRYEKLAADAKNLIGKLDQNVAYHQNYQDSLQAALDWMSQVKDRQSICADTSGDRLTIQNKLDRLHELVTTLPEGVTKIKECERNAELTMDTTAVKGRQSIQQEMEVLKLDWEDYTLKLNSLKENLEQALHYWTIYDEKYDKVLSWIKAMEKQVKEVPLRSTLEEKQEQHAACQEMLAEYESESSEVAVAEERNIELMQEIRGKQRDMDKFSDDAQTLQQLTGESRVGNFVSQLSNRYQTLLTNTKDLIKKTSQNIDDHKLFKDKYNDCSQWLAKAKAKFAECSDSGGSRAELENKLERAQDLLRERDAGFGKLSAAMESGERLYPSTAPDGRESIRQDLRRLKLDWESLFDDLSAIQRKLEVALVQWTSFDDSYSQVGNWLREMEMQLEGPIVFRATLEEKKSQLLNYKALHQDVLSYQRVMDSITDKAQSLAQSSSDPQLASFISQTGARYKKLCSAAKDRVQQYEAFVANHQEYNDAYNACVEWLNGIREKLSVCSDVSGDRHAIQSRLDKIQDILATKMEGEPRVKNVAQLAEKVLPNTAPQGKDIIRRETEALKDDWEAFITALAKTKSDLETCMDQWKEFESWQERCASWIKESENKLRDAELKGTLQDKQTQLEKLKALQADVSSHQSDLDALSDAAQDLVRMSTDTRVVSQASQLATKYQTLSTNTKELCRRWEQFVLDHQAYTQSFDQCKTWISQMKGKVAGVADMTGDKMAVQDKIKAVQNLLSEKEEGLHMLQIALDNLQIVLPNTSVTGRDNMRRDMQSLQQEFDILAGELNETRSGLEGCLAQWTVYDDSVDQLHRWLQDLETQTEAETQLQNTLQEKKLQLDRVKVLQLNITSQQSTIDNMNDKANSLQQTSKDTNLSNQIHQIVARYDTLQAKAKNLLQKCETNLRSHQVYRDGYLEATDWLATTKDRLNLCSDVRGDRHAVEAQLHKVQEIGNSLEAGQKKLAGALEKGNRVLPETSSQGQELVKQEMDMLSGEFQVLDTDLHDLLNTLENLRDQWHRYEEYYDELSHWIKDTEADMKADSEQKATREDKIVQLDKQKGMHDEILRQQTAFDGLAEQAQILMQLSKDSRVSTQLSQMSSRYSALISLSKDLMKRYEQHVQDHQQYAEVYEDAVSWLQSTRDRLSVCADTTGDRYTVQTQLEKLQEFSVLKEEGQALLHTANTWGEKTMTNTSVTGREMIRQELQQLQTDWADLLSEVSDTKVLLEACLLRWTEFSDSHDQVLRWMKDMEKKLRETQPKADIGEKRAELQRIKVLYQDIVSYEQMIESVSTKAHSLSEKSPTSLVSTDTSQIATRYTTIKEQAKELLAKNEQFVANHQDYIDSCNNFVSWLRTAIEKLATCSDTFGERSVIEGKIERVQSLLHNLSEGTQRLSQATKSGESTLPSTSPQGQTKIRQELQSMHKDFDEFRGQLVQAQSDLEMCLTRWEEFEESYQAFAQWLKDTENQVRSELDLKTTVEEKKMQWELYQRHLEEIISHQSILDRVSEKAQALLQTNADAKTSHAITQITTRYQAVIAHCKDIVSNLEFYFNNHLTYRENLQRFQDWLRETRQQIHTLEDDRGSREKVTARLEHAEEIQSAMDQGHSLLRALLDSCEKTLPSTSNKGCQSLRQETETAKTDYENLLTDMSQAKRSLENALSHWGDFDRLYDQLNHWLTDVENKLRTESDNKADLPEKRSNMEKFKAIQADIVAHKDMLGKLEEKAAQVKDSGPRGHVAGLIARYQAVITESKDAFMKAEDEVKGHEEYRKAYIACLDWLANTKHRLQRLSDYSGDKRTLQDRLSQLKDFKADLRQGQEMLNRAAALGERVCDRTSVRGRPAIQREVEGLREDWTAFSMAVADVETNLESCIANWVELDDDHVAIMNWIDKMDARVRGLVEPKPNLSRKQQQYQEGEDVYDEINGKKAALDQIREKGESIAQRSSDPRLSNSMMQLSSKFQSLCSLARSTLQKLKDNVHDHRCYDDSLDTAAKWLAMTAERVQACSDTAGDWGAIQDRIADIKDVTASMDEGLQKVNYVCDMAEKILPATSPEGKRNIEEQVTELTNEWERINSSINDCSDMLEGVQQRWHDYEEYYGSIVKWLAEVENQLQLDPEPRAQLTEKKTQLDKYKMILADIDHRQRLVNELADRVANLEALCDNPDVSDSLTDVQNRYDDVRTRAKSIVSELQGVYDDHLDFHESQQECEKWLLQTSFRLMSHNSLNVSSLELTQRQIDKHRALIHEIDSYRLTLDGVSRKGQQLIASAPRLPRLAQHVQSQLQNLEESYHNLQSTAQQIKDRLQEVLDKWQQYKALLDSTSRYLAQDFQEWIGTNQSHSPDTLTEAQQQREAAQAMLEKLQGMKQEVASAAHRCENLGSMENLDQTEAAMESAVSRLADTVNSDLNDSIAQVEKRLDRLRDMIRQWDNVERERSGLRQWLHAKREDVQDIERKPVKLHAEAAEIEIDQIKALRDEVMARGPAVDQFVSQYRALTQHNPALADPVIQAVRDDWEELIGQLDNLLSAREQALIDTRELQNKNDTMDEDLEDYARALERIDRADAAVEDKGIQMKPQRRRCRSTQTPNSSQNFYDSFDDDPDGFDSFGPKRPRGPPGPPGARGGFPGTKGRLLPTTPRSHNRSYGNLPRRSDRDLNRSRRDLNRSRRSERDLNRSRRSDRDLKKVAGAAGGLESDSEESGYGDTVGETMHASSFDTHLDDPSDWMGSETLQDPSVFADSDTESNASYVTGIFLPVNPEDQRHRASQTPGHARTQTDDSMFERGPRTIQTQTESPSDSRSMQASTSSLHSIGNQTRKKSNSKANLLRSILTDVKELKKQQGLSSANTSMRDDLSLTSDATIRRETLQGLYHDVHSLRAAGRQGDATTQTLAQQSTQTSNRLFPEGDRQLHARHGRFQDIMEEVRHLRGGDQSALRATESRQSVMESPSTILRTTPARFDSPQPLSSEPAVAAEGAASAPPNGAYMNGYAGLPPPGYGDQYNMYQGAAAMPGPHTTMGRRRVTQDDLNAINTRLDRLRNLQVPPRGRAVPMDTAMYQQDTRRVLPEPPHRPNRYRVREFTHSYDDMDVGRNVDISYHTRRSRRSYDDIDAEFEHHTRRSRRHGSSVMGRYGLDYALDEAAATARQLKRMSSKMRRNLHDELSHY